MSHETWQLVNSLECLLSQFVKLFNTKDNNKSSLKESYYRKINFKVKFIWAKYFLNEINCKQPLISNTVYGRRHSKQFTNCHVLWDTLYIYWFDFSAESCSTQEKTGIIKEINVTYRGYIQPNLQRIHPTYPIQREYIQPNLQRIHPT